MPTLSDPGTRLIGAAVKAGIPVEIIPGPSAITAALAGSGLACERFHFAGFLPHKSGRRRRLLAELAPLPCPIVFFESPYRLVKCLTDARELLGNRQTVVARELTKKFEEFMRGDLDSLLKSLENRTVKGEITVIIEAAKNA
jgi:16S rRNA (cytidine1402-2'-O)-methyltransferase